MHRNHIAIAAAFLVAVAGGSYAAKRLIHSGAAGIQPCPRIAAGWRGQISGPQLRAERAADEARVIRLVNAFRRANHLRPLSSSRPLALAARAHDADMDKRDYFDHDRPGLSFERRLARYTPATCIAENIAWGTGSLGSPRGTVEAWKHSPGHRRVMLLTWIRRVGVGVHRSDTGFQDVRGAIITTADFSS